ncbi:MAG: CRISPR-associated protein Cas4 [Vicinamibacteria bacterium]
MVEDDYLPLSGLAHLGYCERRCALIHVNGLFEENELTSEGRLLHESVASPGSRSRDGARVETDVWVRSERLRLVGKTDRIESWEEDGSMRIVPVESKRSKRRSRTGDALQICAQAMALEEMRGVTIPVAEMYYINSKRRATVNLTVTLRDATEAAARRFHELVRLQEVPSPVHDKRCPPCSLRELCLPSVFEQRETIRRYLEDGWRR